VEVAREEGVRLVTPLRLYEGEAVLTRTSLYFFADTGEKPGEGKSEEGGQGGREGGALGRRRWVLGDLAGVFLRRFLLRDSAVEIFLRRGRHRSFFLDFGRGNDGEGGKESRRRDAFLWRMFPLLPRLAWRQPPRTSPDFLLRRHQVTQAWQRREISNYDYLMALNTMVREGKGDRGKEGGGREGPEEEATGTAKHPLSSHPQPCFPSLPPSLTPSVERPLLQRFVPVPRLPLDPE